MWGWGHKNQGCQRCVKKHVIPSTKFLDLTKLKAFADDKFKFCSRLLPQGSKIVWKRLTYNTENEIPSWTGIKYKMKTTKMYFIYIYIFKIYCQTDMHKW